jgi:hypothetical protein
MEAVSPFKQNAPDKPLRRSLSSFRGRPLPWGGPAVERQGAVPYAVLTVFTQMQLR